jgi:hypothetical protein
VKTNIFAIGLAILILSGCSLTPNAYDEVLNDGSIDHAIVRVPTGETYQAQTGKPYTGTISYEFTFDKIFIKE